MLKSVLAFPSFEERKKAAPNLEFLVDKAMSNVVFKKDFLNDGIKEGNDNDDGHRNYYLSSSFKERDTKLTKNGHKHKTISFQQMTNMQNALIKDYINQIIDIQHKEGLHFDQMEDKVYNSKISSQESCDNCLIFEAQDPLLNKNRHLLKHFSDNLLQFKHLDTNKNSTISQTQVLPNYIGLKQMGMKQALLSQEDNTKVKAIDNEKKSVMNYSNDNRQIMQSRPISQENNSDTSSHIDTSLPFMTNQNLTKMNSKNKQLFSSKTSKSSYHSSTYLKKSTSKEEIIKQYKEENFRSLRLEYYNVYDSFSDNEEEIDDSKWVIHPESIINQIRHLFLSLLLSYIIIFVPINVAFFSSFSFWFFTLDTIADICFFLDFFVSFIIPFPLNELEIYVFDYKQIAVHYISTWAVVDLLAAIPFSSISSIRTYSNLKPYFIIELAKLLKIIKCLKQALHLDTINKIKVNKSSGVGTSSQIDRLILFAVLFIAFNHIFACLWAYLGTLTNPNWIVVKNLQDESNVDIYFAAMYYNFATIFTVGYGDIVPVSLIERHYNILLQSVGLFLYSFVISSIMNIVKKSSISIILEKKLFLLNSIRCQYSMNTKLYNKIFQVLINDKQLSRKQQFSMINDFPLHIRIEMIHNMYKDLIQYKLFLNTNYDFISRVIMNLKEMTCLKADILIKEHRYVDELILVKRGRLSIECLYHGKLIRISQILRGEHYGEVNMLLNKRSLFDIVVKTKVAQIYVLQKSVLIEIVSDSSDIFKEKEQKAIINMNLFKSKLRKKKRLIDELSQSDYSSKKSIDKKKTKSSNNINSSNINSKVNSNTKEYITKKSNQLEIIPELIEENIDTILIKKSLNVNDQNIIRSSNKHKKRNINHKLSHQIIKQHNSSMDITNINPKDSILISPGRKSSVMSSRSLISLKQKKLSSIRRDTIMLDENIKSGSMNINHPKVFYSTLFLKLNYDNQISHMNKLFKKIKKQHSSNIISVIQQIE